MISDTLADAIDEIELYQKSRPEMYSDHRLMLDGLTGKMREVLGALEALHPPTRRNLFSALSDGVCQAITDAINSTTEGMSLDQVKILYGANCFPDAVELLEQVIPDHLGNALNVALDRAAAASSKTQDVPAVGLYRLVLAATRAATAAATSETHHAASRRLSDM